MEDLDVYGNKLIPGEYYWRRPKVGGEAIIYFHCDGSGHANDDLLPIVKPQWPKVPKDIHGDPIVDGNWYWCKFQNSNIVAAKVRVRYSAVTRRLEVYRWMHNTIIESDTFAPCKDKPPADW